MGQSSGMCEYSGIACTTDYECNPAGFEQCLQTTIGMCVPSAAIEVQDEGYGLYLGGAGDTEGDTPQTLGPICAYLYDCACVESSSTDLCYGVSQGYYSEAGCQTILDSIDYC